MSKGLFIRLDRNVDKALEDLCSRRGYKKSGIIERLIRELIAREGETKDPIATAQAFGIDLIHLRENLRYSPTERLRRHATVLTFVHRLRRAKEGSR